LLIQVLGEFAIHIARTAVTWQSGGCSFCDAFR
jgi:hypothetical protein